LAFVTVALASSAAEPGVRFSGVWMFAMNSGADMPALRVSSRTRDQSRTVKRNVDP